MRRSASSATTNCRCSESWMPRNWRWSDPSRAPFSPETIVIAVPPPRQRQSRRGGTEFPHDPLFEALRAWRRDRAKEQGVPPYVIFHDATLRAVAALKPSSLRALSDVEGIGDTKLERHGESLLDALNQAMEKDDATAA